MKPPLVVQTTDRLEELKKLQQLANEERANAQALMLFWRAGMLVITGVGVTAIQGWWAGMAAITWLLILWRTV